MCCCMVVAKLGLAAGLNLSSWWCTPPFAQAHKDQIYTLLLCIVLLSRYSFDSFLFLFPSSFPLVVCLCCWFVCMLCTCVGSSGFALPLACRESAESESEGLS